MEDAVACSVAQGSIFTKLMTAQRIFVGDEKDRWQIDYVGTYKGQSIYTGQFPVKRTPKSPSR